MLKFCLGFALLGATPTSFGPVAHPLHTALTEISYDPARSEVAIRIRLFADDLAASVPPAADAAADTAMSRYARATFALVSRSGQPVALRWEGAERTGDTLVLRLGAPLPGGLTQTRVFSAVLWERFPDQINIVQVSNAGRLTTLLFTRGDAAKTVP